MVFPTLLYQYYSGFWGSLCFEPKASLGVRTLGVLRWFPYYFLIKRPFGECFLFVLGLWKHTSGGIEGPLGDWTPKSSCWRLSWCFTHSAGCCPETVLVHEEGLSKRGSVWPEEVNAMDFAYGLERRILFSANKNILIKHKRALVVGDD